jgi:hypothetical protein
MRPEFIEPSRPPITKPPIETSPNPAAGLSLDGIDHLVFQSQSHCCTRKIMSYMAGLSEAHDQ